MGGHLSSSTFTTVRRVALVLVLLCALASAARHSSDGATTAASPTPQPRRTAQVTALEGLELFHKGDLNKAVPLLEKAVRMDALDWVSMEHIAAAFGMAARRIAAAPRPAGADPYSLTPAEERALNATVKYFGRASLARAARAARDAEAAEAAGEAGAMMEAAVAAEGGVVESGAPADSPRTDYAQQQQYAQRLSMVLRGWGDALTWLNRTREAARVFASGVTAGVWRTALCRPTVDRPTVLPANTFFLDANAFSHVTDRLVAALPAMRRELAQALVRVVKGSTRDWEGAGWRVEAAGLHSTRSWYVLPLLVNGKPRRAACKLWPDTCAVVKKVQAARLADGQVKVSLMLPGTRVRPHAGPTNGRLRMHCTLMVPPEPGVAQIRVGGEWKSWQEGECLVFDESCEHEVKIAATASTPRVVLIVDFANPFLVSEDEYLSVLTPRVAKRRGAVSEFRSFQRKLFAKAKP